MNDDMEYMNRLFGKYIRDEISEEELEILFKSIKERDFENFVPETEMVKYFRNEIEDLIGEEIPPDTQKGKVLQFNLKWIASVAAAILLLVVSGVYLYQLDKNDDMVHDEPVHSADPLDVMPGQNYAVLTSSKGENIILSDTDDGQLNTGEGVEVLKVNDGELIYKSQGQAEKNKLIYNTLSTPRGGQYQLTLSDGTRVWLNAASSLRYPVRFDYQGERQIFLEGEAYFEIAPNRKQPFVVTVNDMRVEVVGTHFNVSAYQDEEQIMTTLVEGAVKVSLTGQAEIGRAHV